MQKIVLMRHGEANQEKNLSSQGKIDVERVSLTLKDKIDPFEIWHSPKARAKQTAEIVQSHFEKEIPLVEKSFLNPNDDPTDALLEITALGENIIIVSHLPFLPDLLSLLVQDKINFSFFPATAVFVEKRGDIWESSPDIQPQDFVSKT